ncbi:sucrase ferredoxin [Marisediminicola senii]|uniref:sucrase ferredoxin n=1 Tax=Marisediminicola senii TaxID=2711233 RepID=UPI0013EA1024|nr:sucrase ferredoxin [Marisediminicola senii]
MTLQQWEPCSDRSLERADPLDGSAGYGERWFLVEIDGAWGTHALLQSRLPPDLGRSLVTRVEKAGYRPLAIRRTGRRADQRREQNAWRWAIVDSRVGSESVVWGSVTDPADLLTVPLDGSTGQPSDEPVLCVCTHARHDQCCAVKGRPVVAALARSHPELTWECSHLGGDRFAATMIVFPHGLYYGRVPASDAPNLVTEYRAARIDPRYFRGRSSLPNVVQAAEAYARAASEDHRIDAYGLRSSTQGHDGTWVVEFDHDTSGVGDSVNVMAGRAGAERVEVTLAQTMSVPLLSTCGATRAAPVRQFEQRGVRVVAENAATSGDGDAREADELQ